MDKIRQYLGGICLALLLSSMTLVNGIFEDVALAIESGNAKEVSSFFEAKVELKIKETEKVYSKTEAEIQLKKFFTTHQPKSFNIIHKGSSKKGSKYAIGQLKTNSGNFRVYVLIKAKNGDSFIKELRFEND